jgi:Tfp pilus assembly protein PilN
MKAVNLIPEEARGRSRAKPGTFGLAAGPRDGMGAYVLLAALAVAVLMAGAWAMTGKQLSDGRSDLARANEAAQAAEAKGAALAPFKTFAALSTARVETVRGLLDGRFDWSHGLHEVARVLPRDIDLISLVGTTSPNSSVQGAAGSSARSSVPAPAIDLIGCAKTQSDVARLLARLRSIDGVQRVSLTSSEKADSASLSQTDCRSSVKMPQFQVTVFFQAPSGIAPAAGATTTAATAAATAPAGGTK